MTRKRTIRVLADGSTRWFLDHRLAALCLLALPSYRERTERSPRTGLTYTVGGWRWPGLPWPLNRKGLGSGTVVWHDEKLLVTRHGREGPPPMPR